MPNTSLLMWQEWMCCWTSLTDLLFVQWHTISHLTAVWTYRGAQHAQRLLSSSKILYFCFVVHQSPFSIFTYSYNCWCIKSVFFIFCVFLHFGAYVPFRCIWPVLMKSRDLLHKHLSSPEGFVLNGRREHEGSVDPGCIFHRSAQDRAQAWGRCVPRGTMPWSILELQHIKSSACWCFCLFVSHFFPELYIRRRTYTTWLRTNHISSVQEKEPVCGHALDLAHEVMQRTCNVNWPQLAH